MHIYFSFQPCYYEYDKAFTYILGKKKDFTSLPYSKIQAYSVESAGVFDLDSELDLWFSGMGRVRFEFVARANVSEICRIISERVL